MDYRMRRVTFHTKYTYEIEYDDRFRTTAYGSTQDALKEINDTMDVYGFKKAEIVDAMTGEVVATIEEEEP
jgi:outer membrane receptor for Fe3+-dicitrate